MSESTLISVLVVDDHPIVRNGLQAMLLSVDDLQPAGEAKSGREALNRCHERQPDVILMDMVMPEMNGVEATRAILAAYPQIKIIVLTSFPEDDLVQQALDAGATGYVLKNVSLQTLAETIRSVHAGEPTLGPEATAALIRSRTQGREVGHDLSPREREVLALVAQGKSNIEIGEAMTISPATVRRHVSACLGKLGVANRTQATALAIEHNLVSAGDNAS